MTYTLKCHLSVHVFHFWGTVPGLENNANLPACVTLLRIYTCSNLLSASSLSLGLLRRASCYNCWLFGPVMNNRLCIRGRGVEVKTFNSESSVKCKSQVISLESILKGLKSLFLQTQRSRSWANGYVRNRVNRIRSLFLLKRKWLGGWLFPFIYFFTWSSMCVNEKHPICK